MPAGGVFALGRPARLVENHLLVVADGLTHGLGELEPVKVLEAFGIHGDHVHFLGIHEVAHHVPERQVGLVAHRNQIGRAHFRGLAEPVQQEGPALADDGGAADRIGLVVRHLGGGDEPRVEFAGPGNDAHAVRPEKRRAAVAAGGEALVGFVDAGDHARGHVAAFLGFPEAAGDEHHGVRGVVLDDVVDQRRHLFRADGDDEQVERFGQGLDVGHAAHAAGVGFAFADDGQPIAIEAGIDDVFKDDAPEVPAFGGYAHYADGLRVQQVVDFFDGAGHDGFAGRREAAHAVQRHHQIVRKRERVDFQFLDDERCAWVGGRKVVAHADEGLETFDELVVGHDAALSARQARQLPIGDGLAEQLEEGVPVRQFGQGRDDGLPLAEAFGVEFGIRAAETGADDHAEFAGTAQAHDQLVAEGFGVRRHELHLKHALDVGGDGVLERGSGQPPVARRRGGRAAFDPFRIPFRDFREHAAHGGAHLVGRLGHDADAAHFGLVDDGGRNDLEHGLFAGQGHDFLFHRLGVSGNEGTLGRRFRPGKAQEVVDFEFVEKMPPLGVGVAEQLGDRLVFYGQIHARLRKRVDGKATVGWTAEPFYPFLFTEGIGFPVERYAVEAVRRGVPSVAQPSWRMGVGGR